MITHVHPDDHHHLQTIANLLGTASKIVTLAGAGISTNAGIPDFRSKDGTYSRGYRHLFRSSVLVDTESRHLFHEHIAKMRQVATNADPTKTHRFIRNLHDAGKLVRHYTQNIDCLEEKTGLCTDARKGLESVECVLLHGSLHHFRCSHCPVTFRHEVDREMETDLDPVSPCPACTKISNDRKARVKRASAIGRLRPDIVLYDELDPRAESISAVVRHDQSLRLDVLLIMGTSLATDGVRRLIRDFAEVIHKRRVGKVVFVNLTKPAKSWDNVIDYWVKWDCDVWVGDLTGRQPALNPSAANFGASLNLPLPENAQGSSRGGTGTSADDAILISSDDESDDDLDEARSELDLKSTNSFQRPYHLLSCVSEYSLSFGRDWLLEGTIWKLLEILVIIFVTGFVIFANSIATMYNYKRGSLASAREQDNLNNNYSDENCGIRTISLVSYPVNLKRWKQNCGRFPEDGLGPD